MSMIYISLCILLNMLDKYNSLFILTCLNYRVITKKKKKIDIKFRLKRYVYIGGFSRSW